MLRLAQRAQGAAGFDRPEGMPKLLHRLLCARGMESLEDAERFLNPDHSQLNDPMLLSGMGEAVRLIREAARAGQTACVFGDYDVDGVCATAILMQSLPHAGLHCFHHIPSRHEDGYGLNDQAVRDIAERGAKLLITVDCGVTAAAQVALAQSLGLTVIVTDHHQLGEVLPACTLVNPLLNDYPCPFLCGAGVAFKLAQALDADFAPSLIDLAALATVADVVPLQRENRAIVALGLCAMREHPRPGVAQLAARAGADTDTLRAGNIAFQLGPRLNAGGRLGDAERALNLLLAQSKEQAQPLAEALERENQSRREVELGILGQAGERMAGFDFVNRRVIVLHGDDWNVGVIGLAASRLVEQWGLPTVLLTGAGDVLHGSCRSIPGVDIHQALTAVARLLTRFGGHKQAAGLTLPRGNLDAFADALNLHMLKTCDPACFIPQQVYDADAGLSEIDEALISLIERLEPFGFGNPSPVFLSEARIESARRVGQAGAHLSLMVSEGGARRGAIGFRMGGADAPERARRRFLYAPKLNTWGGNTSVQLELKALLPLPHGQALAEAASRYDALLQAFLTERFYNGVYARDWARPQAGCPDASQPIRAMLDSPYGTLAVATGIPALQAFLETSALAGADERFELLIGRWPDGRLPVNAVCLLPRSEPPAGYADIYALDAPLALWQNLPDARRQQRGRAGWLDELPDLDSLRTLYRMVKDFEKRPFVARGADPLLDSLLADGQLPAAAIALGLLVLKNMELVDYRPEPPLLRLGPQTKADPAADPLFQCIRALAQWEGGD